MRRVKPPPVGRNMQCGQRLYHSPRAALRELPAEPGLQSAPGERFELTGVQLAIEHHDPIRLGPGQIEECGADATVKLERLAVETVENPGRPGATLEAPLGIEIVEQGEIRGEAA